ncbi:ribonuclease domain-containing protein [Streptomyces hygroscopicus]|uniref:ribonuclease domain-containing protein n=1 Tax=Streptomyces hygroscopicus TaxID=1912 RepID=UPI00078632B9|nr:ribonuclease domain-containing protein [Streptomyces hygroscopicus]
MDQGGAGPSSRNYRGTFQEYIAHTFDHNPSGEGERTGQDRFVRALNTGDVWFTRDHYKTFSYLGKGPF